MRTTRGQFFVAVVATLGLLGCGAPAEMPDHEAETGHADATPEVHWGYHGDEGPARWSELSDDFQLCGSGTEQSPIDLVDAVPNPTAPTIKRFFGPNRLPVDEFDHAADVVDNGHTMQVILDGSVSVEEDDVHFVLVQMHFHSPSEHTIAGRSFPLEVHAVHRSTDGRFAVLAELIEEGPHDARFNLVVDNLPEGPEDPRHMEGVTLHADDLVPLPERYYRYMGSLTTPPCSEGVRWYVAAEPITLSAEQIAALDAVLHDNNRPVQERGGRDIGWVAR